MTNETYAALYDLALSNQTLFLENLLHHRKADIADFFLSFANDRIEESDAKRLLNAFSAYDAAHVVLAVKDLVNEGYNKLSEAWGMLRVLAGETPEGGFKDKMNEILDLFATGPKKNRIIIQSKISNLYYDYVDLWRSYVPKHSHEKV